MHCSGSRSSTTSLFRRRPPPQWDKRCHSKRPQKPALDDEQGHKFHLDRPTLLNVGELFNVIVIDIFSISVDSVIVVKARSESQARVEALHQRFYFSTLLLFYRSSYFLLFYSSTELLLFYCSTELPLPGSRSFVASAFDPNDPQARVRVKMAPKLTLTAVTTQQRDRGICRFFYFNPETFLSSHKN